MTYQDLIRALNETGIPFREGGWKGADKLHSDYGVYALDDAEDLMADGRHAERFVIGTIDLFCRSGDGSVQAAKIEAAMESIGCPWRYESRQYEQDTGYTHHEWVFYVLQG